LELACYIPVSKFALKKCNLYGYNTAPPPPPNLVAPVNPLFGVSGCPDMHGKEATPSEWVDSVRLYKLNP
jgi:hypothetical protein